MGDNIEKKYTRKQIRTEGKLSDIQLRNLKMFPYHTAIDNVHHSNLINDITYVNYTENSKGLTRLQPLEGLPMFIDDLYIYMYIHEDQIEKIGEKSGKVFFVGGEDGAVSQIGKRLSSMVNEVFGKKCRQKIVFTVNLESEGRYENKIYQTVMRIRNRGADRA